MADAVVLAGAVAKGAFTAGALSVLAEVGPSLTPPLSLRRVVGSSAGALNGVYLAAVAHAGDVGAVRGLEDLWRTEATLSRVIAPSARGIVTGRGLSSSKKLRALLRRSVTPAPARGHGVDVAFVVANLAGDRRSIEGAPATTFEHVVAFDDDAFTSEKGLDAIIDAAVASAAFPFVFVPVDLTVHGRTVPCIDGGAVNNTPLGTALAHPAGIDRLFVVTSEPRLHPAKALPTWLGYASHVAELLIGERLFRDLRAAEQANHALRALTAEIPDAAQRRRVLSALGWAKRREAQIVEIRPEVPLEGNAFAGFVSRRLREAYIDEGQRRARAVLEALPRAARTPRGLTPLRSDGGE